MNRLTLMAVPILFGLAAPAEAAHVHDDADTTVVILMFDGVQIIDFAAPYEVFGQARFNVYTVSADGGPVTTAMGLSVNVDRGFDDAPAADIVLVPGGDVDTVRQDAATLAWLRERSRPADHVLSVCTGSFILADAGLLDGGRATTFHRAFGNFARLYPGVDLVRDRRWVDNGKIVTSAGLASGIDASLHVVAERLGVRKARSVALHLEYEWSPEQGFIRGRMADRHVRMPEQDVDWPEGTSVMTVLQVGDERRWETEYRVDSSLGPRALIRRFASLADADPALTVLPGDSPLTMAWRHTAEDGQAWLQRLTAEPRRPDGTYRILAELTPADR